MPQPRTTFLFAACLLLVVVAAAPLRGSLAPPVAAQLVQDRDAPARQPFQKSFSLTASPGAMSATHRFTVPAGKRLVLEYVNAQAYVQTGSITFFTITTRAQVGGSLQSSYVQLPPVVNTNSPYRDTKGLSLNEHILCYAEQNTNVEVSMWRSFPPGTNTQMVQQGSVNLAGYFVDIP